MVGPTRTERSLPGGHEGDWDLLGRIEDVLAAHADDWDDGSYHVTVTDGLGEHRAGSVGEAREAAEAEGAGHVEEVILRADGSAYSCTVELGKSGGSVVAWGRDATEVEELAGRIQRVVQTMSTTAGNPDRSWGPAVLGFLAVSVAVVVIATLITGEPLGVVLTRPWVVTVVGGLLAILISWLLRRWVGRPG